MYTGFVGPGLVPGDGTTPERVIVKEIVDVGLLVFVHKRFEFVFVQDNDTRDAISLLGGSLGVRDQGRQVLIVQVASLGVYRQFGKELSLQTVLLTKAVVWMMLWLMMLLRRVLWFVGIVLWMMI